MLSNRDAKHLLTNKEKMIAKINKKKLMTRMLDTSPVFCRGLDVFF